MLRLFVLLTSIAWLCGAALLSTKLACPKGGYITRENYCEETPGCANGEDSDTIYPRGPCIQFDKNPIKYRFSCGSKGEVVPLEAMCNGSIECTNGKDESHAFCPVYLVRVKRTEEDCDPSCIHGGVCHGGSCTCPEEWIGDHCQYLVLHGHMCTPRCNNSGVCTLGNKCMCARGWNGNRCQQPHCSPGCLNCGTCIGPNVCLCPSGYTGKQCETPTCTPSCAHGGTCTAPNTCQCPPEWTGERCQIRTDMSIVTTTPAECVPACENSGICTAPNTCQCASGWSGDHCQTLSNGAGGDPHFLVNLPDNSNLCFSLQGEPGFAFNLVTSRTVVINAVFIHSPPALQEWTTVIGEIGVLYYTKSRSILKIHFNFKDKSIYVSGYGVLDAKRVSRVVLNGDKLDVISANATFAWASTVFVSVGDELKFKVFFNHDNLDIVWSDVSSFNHSSHGILGQFFNKGTKIDKEKRQLVLPKHSPIPVILEDPKPEVHHKSQCWRPQTPGYQGEGLLEGHYLDYVVSNVFATDFKYSMT